MSGTLQESRPVLPRSAEHLAQDYSTVRAFSDYLCETLETEDMVIQTMPAMSPTRWHLAHTTWFFETFILKEYVKGYRPHDPIYEYLFNSYYNSVGRQFPRPKRGFLSRPTVKQVFEYRAHVDSHIKEFLESVSDAVLASVRPLVEIGNNHEQQHQELMLTDIKSGFSENPLFPEYRSALPVGGKAPGLQWLSREEGICEIGHNGHGFAYDNEGPRHRVLLHPHALGSRLVTCGEYLEFIRAGGYENSLLWLSEGWDAVQAGQWGAPLYWYKQDGAWLIYTLGGLRAVSPDEPVCHVSYFEADAFARWAGARLPREEEWEAAARELPIEGNFADDGCFHPHVGGAREGFTQCFGDVWEWTQSAYSAYPGYAPGDGALGEYNGKFMCNQYVLRGGSCATSRNHMRATYRNFFGPSARWQFSGIRLAKDL